MSDKKTFNSWSMFPALRHQGKRINFNYPGYPKYPS